MTVSITHIYETVRDVIFRLIPLHHLTSLHRGKFTDQCRPISNRRLQKIGLKRDILTRKCSNYNYK